MRKVLTYGTFDVLHAGHIHLLRRARALGDYLVVGLSSDGFNQAKHKSALLNFANRKLVLESIRWVDEVIAEESWDQKVEDVRRFGIDVFTMGDDWAGEFDFLKEYCDVVYLPRTQGISSGQIRDEIAPAPIGDGQ